MTEEFKIRFQLVQFKEGLNTTNERIMDWFLMDIPEHSRGVISSYSEAPYLVAINFFNNMKKRLES